MADNTFNIRNESRIFPAEQCIFGNGGKYGVVAINGAYPAKPIEVTEVNLSWLGYVGCLRPISGFNRREIHENYLVWLAEINPRGQMASRAFNFVTKTDPREC